MAYGFLRENSSGKKTLFPPRLAFLLFLLLLASLVASCEDNPTTGEKARDPWRQLLGSYEGVIALFGFSNSGDRVFTQHVNGDGMGYELMNGRWADDEGSIIRFNTAEKQLIMGHKRDGGWWLQQFLPTGDPGRVTDQGTWRYTYETMAGYQVYGKPFIFGQDKGNYQYWFIQKIEDDGTMGPETDNGYWDHYWERVIALDFDGPTFLMGHTSEKFLWWDYGKRRWFIQRVHDSGQMGAETDSGTWEHYYGNLTFFKTTRSHFIYGQSEENNHWFIQRVHSTGKLGGVTDSGQWEHYYDTVTTFMDDGKVYLFAQSKNGNRWFLQHITADGTMGGEEDSGQFEHHYDFVHPFKFDWQYRYVSNWMGRNYDLLKDRKLKRICIPGSHDSGMHKSSECLMASGCNTITQKSSIAGQLEDGARYFDFRPAYNSSEDTWYLAHYQMVAGNEWGCAGEKMSDALSSVRDFLATDENSRELVILDFSHCAQKNEWTSDEECSQADMDDFVGEIQGYLEDLLVTCDGCDPRDMTLEEIHQAGGGRVIAIVAGWDEDRESGIFNHDNFYVFNEYSHTSDLDTMRDKQVQKLMHADEHKYFVSVQGVVGP